MLPSAAAGEPPTGPDWRIEVAWTGHRCVAYVHPDGRVRLLSGAANSMTAAYPELAAPLRERCPPGGMVLDGTLVARGEEHAPRPRLLTRRAARARPSELEIAATPVDYQVADLLFLDGRSTIDLPHRDRRALLEGLGLDSAPVWTTALFPASELDALMRIAAAEGVEAFHARHAGARYRPGARSRSWVRVPVQRRGLVLVGGWTPTDPQRRDTIGALLLGVPGPGGGLRYVGRVGVSVEERRRVERAGLRPRRTSPFAPPPVEPQPPEAAAAHAVWVEPEVAGRVEHVGWVAGARLRLPRWCGLVAPDAVDPGEFAVPPRPAPRPAPAAASAAPGARLAAVEARRLEQHFVYNSLNTVASLIRTDPGRARELLLGFADLSRAADGPPRSTLGRELDAVRAYLELERARFGPRLQAVLELGALDGDAGLAAVPVGALQVLELVRSAVQQDIEPRPGGGRLTLTVRRVDAGCEVAVTAADGAPARLVLRP
jgi:hypothetical protein